MKRVILLIVDGWGIGAQEDAIEYGDQLAHTMGHVSEETMLRLPNFKKMGLGNIATLASIPPTSSPIASYGKLREKSSGKDSTTGHWELAGIVLDAPFPTYPKGFPLELIQSFCAEIGTAGVLCNSPYSGTNVIADFGTEHIKTGFPIVYTSADSVFQIATHEDIVPIETLYEWCDWARNNLLVGEHEVGRVIARPFKGEEPLFERISHKRHDWSAAPPKNHLVTELKNRGLKTASIGKVADLFNGEGFDFLYPTKGNTEGIEQIKKRLRANKEDFLFINLIDTDQLYGHRLDPVGYAEALMEIDSALPAIMDELTSEDLLIITGDHGNDPCVQSTDHTREFVPVLLYGKRISASALGVRDGFSQVAVSIMDFFGYEKTFGAESLL